MDQKVKFIAVIGAAVFCYRLARKCYLEGFNAGYDCGKDRAENSQMSDDEFLEYRLSK